VKSDVRVDGGGTGVVIDVGRDCRVINHGGSGGGGDDGWDDSHVDGGGVVVINDGGGSRACDCGFLGVVGDCAGDILFMVGDCACKTFFVYFFGGREV
jgi:hypothetical protein